MTTEPPSLPSPAAAECHKSTLLEIQENPQTLRAEIREMAKNVVLTASLDDSWVPPLDGALISFAEDPGAEEPSTSVGKDGRFSESALSPLASSETFKMADDDQGQDGDHSVLQSKTPDPFLEQLKAGDALSLSSPGEDGSDPAVQGKTPEAFSEEPNPGETSAQMTEGEEGSPHDCHDTHPNATTDSLKQSQPSDTPNELSQVDKGNPPVHCGDTSEVRSEQPKSDSSISSQLGGGEESWEMDRHGQTPGVAPEFPAQPEVAEGPKEPICSVANGQDPLLPSSPNPLLQEADSPKQQKSDSSVSSQLGVGEESWEMDHHGQTPGVGPEFSEQPDVAGGPKEAACDAANGQDPLLPSSPNPLRQEADSPEQALEGSCHVFPGHDPSGASSAEPQGTFDAADISEGLKPDGQEMTDTGGWESVARGQEQQPVTPGKDLGDLQGQLSEETPEDNSQAWAEPVGQDSEWAAVGTSQGLALTDPQAGIGTCCQQRAAGTGCDTFPEAVAPLCPVATGDSLGPAHGGLAPGGDKEGKEGPNAPESLAAGSNSSKPLGEAAAQAVLESPRGEEATGDAGPEGTIGEPAGAQFLAREVPSLESGTGISPEDPSDAMVLACSEESLDTRRKEDSHNLSGTQYLVSSSEKAGSQAKPASGFLFDPKEPADTEDLVNATGPVCATPVSDELSGAGDPRCLADWMENDAGSPENHCPATETPIEREIRLTLEREELLRRQRGLASSRGAREYVEVRVKPLLSPGVPPSPLPKEKERQWAGAQMQREIRRECQREEDLVQQGKVRGAYDRGTPQELQEKKMLFEQQVPPEPQTPTKMGLGSSEGTRERSFAETDGATGPVVPASSALLQPLAERPSAANPFFSLRSKSPLSLLEREVQEAQERERELQRQRHKIYGSALHRQPEEATDRDEEVPFQPERLPCKKLDVTWPPPSSSEPCQVNGHHQLERSPRSRQKSALIQRWESGTVGNQDSQD